MFKDIVVGIDGSRAAHSAIEIACDLVQKYDGSLHIIHAIDIIESEVIDGPNMPTTHPFQQQLDAGQKTLDEARTHAVNCGVEAKSITLGSNDAVTEITQLVDGIGADLVVLGRRGLGGISGLLLGSISRSVSQSVNCACLTLR